MNLIHPEWLHPPYVTARGLELAGDLLYWSRVYEAGRRRAERLAQLDDDVHMPRRFTADVANIMRATKLHNAHRLRRLNPEAFHAMRWARGAAESYRLAHS